MIEQIAGFYTMDLTVERNVNPTSNGKGGWIDNWHTHLTLRGLIRPLDGSESMISDKLTAKGSHKMYCAIADILETDRVKDASGNIYEIIAPPMNVMNMGNHFQIDLVLTR